MTARLTRRSFVRTAVAASAAAGFLPILFAEQTRDSLKLGTAGARVPDSFIGLSYENMQLEDAGFFSPENKSLIQRFRDIAPKGVLRLGGNTSEFSWWKATPEMSAPNRSESPWKAAGEPTRSTVFAITPQAIDNLDGFLKATGWTCIYGLNLGYGSPALDLPEAVYVSNRLGARLEYFQVGNEVDLFKRHLRDEKTWNVDSYLKEWLDIARSVQKTLPNARFGLPDVAGDVSWLTKIAERWPSIENKPNVVCLSHHHYWGGPPSSPQATAENLLKPDPRVAHDALLTQNAAHAMGPKVQWRMTEGNTIFRGGKDGVSDAFASALWSADYLLSLMSLGYAGANLHGGSGHAQAVSVGGVFHGEALMADPTAPHPKPFYTPIANQGTLAGAGVNGVMNNVYVLEPVAYGMIFAAQFAGSTMLEAKLEVAGQNATAYAATRADGTRLIALINKQAGTPLRLTAPGVRQVTILSAETLESRSASFTRRPSTAAEKRGQVEVPPYTAMLFECAAG